MHTLVKKQTKEMKSLHHVNRTHTMNHMSQYVFIVFILFKDQDVSPTNYTGLYPLYVH